MKKLFYVGLLVYVFWMDEEKKAPIFRKVERLFAQVPDYVAKVDAVIPKPTSGSDNV